MSRQLLSYSVERLSWNTFVLLGRTPYMETKSLCSPDDTLIDQNISEFFCGTLPSVFSFFPNK